jgi:DNA repair exonuclease SbcCD ATPase subunit
MKGLHNEKLYIYTGIISFLLGLMLGVGILFTVTSTDRGNIARLEEELSRSRGLSTELREQNQILTLRQSELTKIIERSNRTIAELTDRNRELESVVESAGQQLATAVLEAGSLTDLIRRIVDAIDILFPDN